jgi:secreted trypsin-like serine protease
MKRDDGFYYARGIVSFGVPLKDDLICDPNYPTVYTDVAGFRDWIYEIVKNEIMVT